MPQVGEVQVAVQPGAAVPKQLWPAQGQLDWHNGPASCSQPAHSEAYLGSPTVINNCFRSIQRKLGSGPGSYRIIQHKFAGYFRQRILETKADKYCIWSGEAVLAWDAQYLEAIAVWDWVRDGQERGVRGGVGGGGGWDAASSNDL